MSDPTAPDRREEMVSLRHYIETRLNEYRDAHARVHELEQRAIEIANRNLEYRLAGLNEWRGQLQDERSTLVARDLFDGALENERKRIGVLENTVSNMRGRNAQTAVALGIGLALLQIGLRFVLK